MADRQPRRAQPTTPALGVSTDTERGRDSAVAAHTAGQSPARVVIERVTPSIDGGRFAIKRIPGETVTVSADIFAEGHDQLAAVVRLRWLNEARWREVPMTPLGNDRWEAAFTVTNLGRYEYGIDAWVDSFATWSRGLAKKVEAGFAVHGELLEGAELVRQAAARADAADAGWLREQAAVLGSAGGPDARVRAALSEPLAQRMARHPDRSRATVSTAPWCVQVERERAGVGAWYEMFPRSCAAEPGRHGTFADCEMRLPSIASMGFDVLYLPPIHPIGVTHRKGRNNSPAVTPEDPGSPWAIGAGEGGHTSVHPALGTLADFDHLVAQASQHGIEIALDLAFQCSPDHPYVQQHPEWFHRRPDGTVQYAENPPKQYQDIYPLNFESDDWQALWEELKRVVLFWIEHGVRIFRVDNPHTKPFAFWEWLIREVHAVHADVIFLAEAFTRPQAMRYLAKVGFSQSYTYFTWRNTKAELIDYFTELNRTEVQEYMRPNLFANTPDILTEYLQAGGRPAFQIRLVLAATLAGNYGIYGPAFELCERRAVPDSEEYLDSEKFELRHWDLDQPESLRGFIARMNQIRRENPALRQARRLRFCTCDNEQLLVYARTTSDLSNVLLVAVNLDPHHAQSGWLDVPLAELGLDPGRGYQAHDLLGDARYLWHGARAFISIDPQAAPAQVFRVRRKVRTERDFDYFM